MNGPRSERVGGRLELPPKLKLVPVTARTIGEAMDKSRKNGAGEDELEEILTYLNKNRISETANHWRPTFNFFPNAGGGEEVPYVSEFVGKFWRDARLRGFGWGGYGRVVEKD